MHDREIRDLLRAATHDLELINARMPDTRRNLRHWNTRGYPSSSMGPGARGHTHPVGSIAVAGPDQITKDLRASEQLIARVSLDLTALVRICNAYTTVPNTRWADEGCRLCASQGRYAIVYAQDRYRWHYDFHRDRGEDAHPAVTLRYLDGRRVSEQFIASYHQPSRIRP